ncbi:LemA family protein [Candidatus Peregrinibacteria bacterium]|nr:LemA family protein [Candidatus Peregrinibacteria bacterium]
MKTSQKVIIGILGIVLISVLYVWSTYNRLVTQNETVDGQWAQVEVQYQRRFDLIPNLVESVRGILVQEQKIFGEIAQARTRYAQAQNVNEKAGAATQIEGALSRLLVIMENYPQLKSSENILSLMAQLEGTENRISVERKRFNDEAKNFNLLIKRFPSKWIADWFGFSQKVYFEATEGAETPPKVDLQTP